RRNSTSKRPWTAMADRQESRKKRNRRKHISAAMATVTDCNQDMIPGRHSNRSV
ncbi:hypothetical protein AVEN_214971-1, partial [Araneus ventricosus]